MDAYILGEKEMRISPRCGIVLKRDLCYIYYILISRAGIKEESP